MLDYGVHGDGDDSLGSRTIGIAVPSSFAIASILAELLEVVDEDVGLQVC